MRKLAVIALFFLTVTIYSAAGHARTILHLVPGVGAGRMWCSEWTAQRRKGGAQAQAGKEWVLGYLSAWQDYAAGRRVSLDLEANDMLAAIDRNCAISPDESVSLILSQFLYRRYEKRWGLKRAD